jgi:hypothetical protein
MNISLEPKPPAFLAWFFLPISSDFKCYEIEWKSTVYKICENPTMFRMLNIKFW